MEKLKADLETIETLLSNNGGSPAEKAAGMVRVVEAKALLLLAERLRREE